MAIGQLADYRRFLRGDPKRTVLLSEPPSGDLLELLHADGIGVLVPTGAGFTELSIGAIKGQQDLPRRVEESRREP